MTTGSLAKLHDWQVRVIYHGLKFLGRNYLRLVLSGVASLIRVYSNYCSYPTGNTCVSAHEPPGNRRSLGMQERKESGMIFSTFAGRHAIVRTLAKLPTCTSYLKSRKFGSDVQNCSFARFIRQNPCYYSQSCWVGMQEFPTREIPMVYTKLL